MGILKAYISPILQLLGVIGIAVCSIWYSSWYNQGHKDYLYAINKDSKEKTTTATFWDVAQHYSTSIDKPIIYTGLSLVVSILGGGLSFRNQYKIRLYDNLDKDFRKEKENHAETQKNYYEAISYIIHSIFVSTNDHYNKHCRITIYRHTNDNQLKKIYRHANQTRFQHGGRIKIPDDEGIVGAAWFNDGIAHISTNYKPGNNQYRKQLEKELEQHGAKMPSEETRMPTRDYFAMAIRDSYRMKMAVIVLESTEPNTFKRDKLEELIKQENSEIAKYIVHKGKLDEILNPDGDLGNV